MKDFLQKKFQEIYNTEPNLFFFAPARVNLIGEHIDYNGGLVMPAALERGTYLAIRERSDDELHFHSLNFSKEDYVYHISDEGYTKKENRWVNFPIGILDAFIKRGYAISKGLDLLYFGNIPNGGGLSSSASIEVVTAYALNQLTEANLPNKELALLSQRVENKFIGVNSGIMDQYAVSLGKKDHVLILDCEKITHEYAPFKLKDHELVIINTNKERKLADSKYNERRATCEESLKILNQQGKEYPNLCGMPLDYFLNNKHHLTEEQQKRVMHVITEQLRVLESKEALSNNDIERFGELMNQSHASLKLDYEVTGIELDTVNEESLKLPYVIGCRMTGAGFGGCAIALVENNKVEAYKTTLEKVYKDKIGYAPTIIDTKIGDGVKSI